MTILTINMDFTGMEGFVPRHGKMTTNDDLATVTSAGYLNNSSKTAAVNFVNGDFIDANYNGGSDTFVVSVASNNIITLSLPTNTDVPAYVQNITPGVSVSGKAIVLDVSGDIDGVSFTTIEQAGASIAGSFASVATVSTTPATGSCAAQFQLRTPTATSISQVTPVRLYKSDVSGNIAAAATSIVALTNGTLVQIVTGQIVEGTSNASGQVGITLTASAGTYYVSFVLPNGKIFISPALVVN